MELDVQAPVRRRETPEVFVAVDKGALVTRVIPCRATIARTSDIVKTRKTGQL
jgi:hypothetical protein